MFDNLSQRLQTTLKHLRGAGRLSEDNISEALREVRMALLEADVALPAVKRFIDEVRAQAVGQEVLTSLTPGQAVVKVVHDALVKLMGTSNDRLNLAVRPPAVVLVAGLQGSGKTTSVAKLARLLRERARTRSTRSHSRRAQVPRTWATSRCRHRLHASPAPNGP